MMAQFAEDISREVEKRAAALQQIKKAVVDSFEAGTKKPLPKCCQNVVNYTVDPRFPGEVTTKTNRCSL